MGNAKSMSVSKRLNHWGSRRKSKNDKQAEPPSVEEMNDFRERGQAVLRSMITNTEYVDWNEVIRTANALHAQEQEWLLHQDPTKKTKRERFRFQKRALSKRKKREETGSFSANLLTYRDPDASANRPRSRSGGSKGSMSGTFALDDHSSLGSNSNGSSAVPRSHSSNPFMEVIEEEIEI